jgi:hypothetical protein
MAAAGINWVVDQTRRGAEGAARRREALRGRPRHGRQRGELDGLTALHGAANRGSDDIIRFLVERGARPDARDSEGRTPLTWAGGVFLATHPAKPKPASMALISGLLENVRR